MSETPGSEPTTLDDLFNRDPSSLSDDEVRTIVVKLREQRAKWAQEEAAGKRSGSRKRPKGIKKEKLGDIKLGDLTITEEDLKDD